MKSVFNTPPPDFSQKEVQNLVEQHFKIVGSVKPLVSDRDQNFLINSLQGDFIFKISNPMENKDVLKMQNNAIRYIKDNDIDIELTYPQVSNNGDKIIEIKKNNVTFFVRLLKYIDGTFLKDIDYNKNLLFRSGKFLGRFDLALAGYDHPAAHRSFVWNVLSVNELSILINKNRNDKKIINHYLNLFNNEVLSHDDHLQKAIIHNDGNDHNIIINTNGKISGIIDYGDMIYSYRASEPAVCMAYVAIEEEDPFPFIASILKGYNEVNPLNKYELNSIIYLMCIRLCISITMAVYRKKLFPKNEYLIVSEMKSRKFLKNMLDEDLNKWSNRLIEYST